MHSSLLWADADHLCDRARHGLSRRAARACSIPKSISLTACPISPMPIGFQAATRRGRCGFTARVFIISPNGATCSSAMRTAASPSLETPSAVPNAFRADRQIGICRPISTTCSGGNCRKSLRCAALRSMRRENRLLPARHRGLAVLARHHGFGADVIDDIGEIDPRVFGAGSPAPGPARSAFA